MQRSGRDTIHDYASAFQRGDERGFNFFFRELYQALFYYAYRILHDKPASEDVVGESFTRIWQQHALFSHPSVIRSWLYTTVRNICLNQLQQQQRRFANQREMINGLAGVHETYALQDIIRAEMMQELYETIETLPPGCRRIFKMIYIQEKTVRETARELKISISTIKSQKARGLSLLRKKIAGSPVTLARKAEMPSNHYRNH